MNDVCSNSFSVISLNFFFHVFSIYWCYCSQVLLAILHFPSRSHWKHVSISNSLVQKGSASNVQTFHLWLECRVIIHIPLCLRPWDGWEGMSQKPEDTAQRTGDEPGEALLYCSFLHAADMNWDTCFPWLEVGCQMSSDSERSPGLLRARV